MVSRKRVLLLNGSPRKKGTSFSFVRTLSLLAADEGATAEIEHVADYFDGRRSLEQLRERLAGADIIGICAPLYFDTLPGMVVWLLEQIWREMPEVVAGKTLFAISQSAYPFSRLNEPSLQACQCFAATVGMDWMGGLGYGGGVLLDGAPLEQAGKSGRKLIAAFHLAIRAVLAGQPVPAEAQEMLIVRIPKWFYWPLALLLNFRTRQLARKHGAPQDLGGQVYLYQ